MNVIKKDLKQLAIYLIANRALFLILVYFVTISNPLQDKLPFKSFFDFLLTFGKRWDGNSYTFLAEHGYVTSGPEKFFIVFPPLYPLLIKSLTLIGFKSVLAGMFISNTAFIVAMLLFYKLLRLDYNKRFSFLVIFIISVFPTSYFFSVPYPESVFVLLFVLSFYQFRKNKYFESAIFAGVATLTRPFGVIIVPALLFGLLIKKKDFFKKAILFLVLYAPFPAFYLLLNYLLFYDPFIFAVFLKENWYKSFAPPWEGIIASFKRGINTFGFSNSKFLTGYGEGISSLSSVTASVFGIKFFRTNSTYLVYLILATLLFTSTNFILSAPRYLLSIPPFFIVFAKLLEKSKLFTYIWVAFSLVLLFYLSSEFAWGHWTY